MRATCKVMCECGELLSPPSSAPPPSPLPPARAPEPPVHAPPASPAPARRAAARPSPPRRAPPPSPPPPSPPTPAFPGSSSRRGPWAGSARHSSRTAAVCLLRLLQGGGRGGRARVQWRRFDRVLPRRHVRGKQHGHGAPVRGLRRHVPAEPVCRRTAQPARHRGVTIRFYDSGKQRLYTVAPLVSNPPFQSTPSVMEPLTLTLVAEVCTQPPPMPPPGGRQLSEGRPSPTTTADRPSPTATAVAAPAPPPVNCGDFHERLWCENWESCLWTASGALLHTRRPLEPGDVAVYALQGVADANEPFGIVVLREGGLPAGTAFYVTDASLQNDYSCPSGLSSFVTGSDEAGRGPSASSTSTGRLTTCRWARRSASATTRRTSASSAPPRTRRARARRQKTVSTT